MSRHNNQCPHILTEMLDACAIVTSRVDSNGRAMGFLLQLGRIKGREGFGYILTQTFNNKPRKLRRTALPDFDACFPTLEAARLAGAARIEMIERLAYE